MSKSVTMTQGKPMGLLLSFALPLMLGNLFQQLYTVVDTAIVGRGIGLDALAALGTVDWINWMVLGLATGFTQGFSVRISQKYGEGDEAGLKKVVGQAAFLSIAIAAVVVFVLQLGLPFFLRCSKIPDEIIWMAELYMRIILGGFPLVMLYNYCSSVLRAVGDSQTPLKAMIIVDQHRSGYCGSVCSGMGNRRSGSSDCIFPGRVRSDLCHEDTENAGAFI